MLIRRDCLLAFLKTYKYDWFWLFVLLFLASFLVFYPSKGVCLFAFLFLIRLVRLPKKSLILFTGCLILFVGRSYWMNQRLNQAKGYDFPSQVAPYSLVVDLDSLDYQGERLTATADLVLPGQDSSFKVRLSYREAVTSSELEALLVNNLWQVKGQVERPARNRNFHVFNYQDYLARQGIYWQIEIESFQSLRRVEDLDYYQAQIRRYCLQTLKKWQDYSWMALHNKLLFNLSSPLYRQFNEGFVYLGIVHLFAVSGFHLNYLRRLLLVIMWRLGLVREWANKVSLLVLTAYVWLIGGPAGAMRSLLTYWLTAFNQQLDRPLSAMDLLSLSGIVLLAINPLWAFSLAFQLSYLMTFVIRFLVPTLKAYPYPSFWLTLTCQLFVWPLMININHAINPLQIMVILIVSLFFERIFMPMMLMTTLAVYSLGSWAVYPISFLSKLVDKGINLGQEQASLIAWANQGLGHLANGMVILLLGLAVLWLLATTQRQLKKQGGVLLAYGIVLLVLIYVQPVSRLTFLDVGQGDALLYQPAGLKEAWLIDTGGQMNWDPQAQDPINHSHADYHLLPALRALGVDRLTGVIISHPDIDHMGNLIRLNQKIPIDYLITSSYSWQHPNFDLVKDQLEQVRQVRLLEPGQALTIKNLAIAHLKEDWSISEAEASNDRSLLTRIQLDPLDLVTTGDLSQEGEKAAIRQRPDWKGNLIKLGHHGSQTATSSDWLEFHPAQLAIISAGVNNRYGHPHPEVLDRLDAIGLPYLSTDQVGAIQVIRPLWGPLRIETVLPAR